MNQASEKFTGLWSIIKINYMDTQSFPFPHIKHININDLWWMFGVIKPHSIPMVDSYNEFISWHADICHSAWNEMPIGGDVIIYIFKEIIGFDINNALFYRYLGVF